MRLNIPTLKTELTVKEDIEVKIYLESRNETFLKKAGFQKELENLKKLSYWSKYCKKCKGYIEFNYRHDYVLDPTKKKYVWTAKYWSSCSHDESYIEDIRYKYIIPKGSKLIIDRYYIRNGLKEFDSVTFRFQNGKLKGRFWLKLADANRIEFEDET